MWYSFVRYDVQEVGCAIPLQLRVVTLAVYRQLSKEQGSDVEQIK